jgi:hypothetical protein
MLAWPAAVCLDGGMEDRTMCRPTLEHVVEPVPARPMVHRRGASAVPDEHVDDL